MFSGKKFNYIFLLQNVKKSNVLNEGLYTYIGVRWGGGGGNW
jgi:hypothetical protein